MAASDERDGTIIKLQARIRELEAEIKVADAAIVDLEVLWKNAVKARDELYTRNKELEAAETALKGVVIEQKMRIGKLELDRTALREALGAVEEKIIPARNLLIAIGVTESDKHITPAAELGAGLAEANRLITAALKGV